MPADVRPALRHGRGSRRRVRRIRIRDHISARVVLAIVVIVVALAALIAFLATHPYAERAAP